jgi:hypothetical protein
MQKTKDTPARKSDTIEPAALAAQYLRLFARHLPAMSDFDNFMDGLQRLVGEDSYLMGFAELGDASSDVTKLPGFENLGENETVVSVCGRNGNHGFIQYSGRSDGGAFDAGDMHLMGAVAGFISLLASQACEFREQSRAAKVLQYLINQLPLGAVCYGADGALIVQSKMAIHLLGESGGATLSAMARDAECFRHGSEKLHVEVDGKLLYVEGRRLAIDGQLTVTTFVLHDLSEYQYKLTDDLEREALRTDAKGTPLTLAVLQTVPGALPGILFHLLKESADDLQIPKSAIHPLDAFRCACLFPGKLLRSARVIMKAVVGGSDQVGRLSLLQYQTGEGNEAPAEYLLERADQTMEPKENALLPRVLVLDPYFGVSEALRVATAEVCHIYAVPTLEETLLRIESGTYDGLFLGLDDCGAEALSAIHESVMGVEEDFRLFYLSYKQASMARVAARLDDDAIVFQKPFSTDEVCETLSMNLI